MFKGSYVIYYCIGIKKEFQGERALLVLAENNQSGTFWARKIDYIGENKGNVKDKIIENIFYGRSVLAYLFLNDDAIILAQRKVNKLKEKRKTTLGLLEQELNKLFRE